ncbi:MAG: hypothetical protein JO286_16850 [Solirubrobacterales bacterium]|nr:hypothetical protein [Solirubrobacterales bacterium]MBV9683237.1 hypothetical protein [Solirubrobacterales bacterium]MBV9808856.1 hypothetical protein [Solirubrobacterales bacterium]
MSAPAVDEQEVAAPYDDPEGQVRFDADMERRVVRRPHRYRLAGANRVER